MNRRQFVAFLTVGCVAGARASAQTPRVTVVKDPGCGCCEKWVKHLQAKGFATTVTESAEVDVLKDKHRIPKQLRSCHTATVDGYVVEGHVPADAIQRLLKERPAIVGIAVPGMPIGSPGMEVAGVNPQRFNVMAFEKSGAARVFASY